MLLLFSSDCNITIILGKYALEDEAKAPKLLLLHPSGMFCNELFTKSQKDASAQDIYDHHRSFAGRRGFEIRQTCGSLDKVCHKTDHDLLQFLTYNRSILPSMAHGCLNLQAEDRYLFCYANDTPALENKYVMLSYSPPPRTVDNLT